MNKLSQALQFSLLLGLLMGIEGCKTAPESKDSVSTAGTAAENFKAGKQAFLKRKFEAATKLFEEAKLKDPSSRWAIKAQLGLADTLFLQEDYVGAAERYREFIDEHPYYEKTTDGYCAFMIGKSYYLKIPRDHFYAPAVYERDLGDIEEAEIKLAEFLHLSLQSPYITEAQKMHETTVKLLIQHELYVARYYLKRKKWTAAQWRLEFARNKSTNQPLEADVLFLLGEVYLKQNRPVNARDTFLALQSKYPSDSRMSKIKSYLQDIGKSLPQSATQENASTATKLN